MIRILYTDVTVSKLSPFKILDAVVTIRGLRSLRDMGHRPVGRAMFMLTLCFVLWRGPIPVPHLHGLGTDSPSAALLQHLGVYHRGECSHADDGWHFHFVLPWSRSIHGEPDDPLFPAVPVSLLTDGGDHVAELRVSLLEFGTVLHLGDAYRELIQIPSEPLPSLKSRRIETNFLSSLFDSASARAVIAVALC